MLSLKKVEIPPELKSSGPLAEAEYLKKDGHMKGFYLGDCLDRCRWGSMTTVMYEMNTLEMAEFIKNWMEQNKGNLMFHFKGLPTDFKLPYTEYDSCPRNSKHKIRNMGIDGTVRCIDEDVKVIKKDYLDSVISHDEFSNSRRKHHWERHPLNGRFEDEEEEAIRLYEESTETVTVRDRCGAIISEKGVTFPLAEILERLNLYDGSFLGCKGDVCGDRSLIELYGDGKCRGHTVYDHFVVPFNGWALARYAQKWHEQESKGTAQFTTPALTKKIVRKTTTPDRFEKEMKRWERIFSV